MEIMIDGVTVTATPEQEAELLEAQKAFNQSPLPVPQVSEQQTKSQLTAMGLSEDQIGAFLAAASKL
jgi:hypothetical protein